MDTNANTQTAPGAMNVGISVDDLYANMNLKVRVASHASSSGTEQGSYEVSLIPKSLCVMQAKDSDVLSLLQQSHTLSFFVEVR